MGSMFILAFTITTSDTHYIYITGGDCEDQNKHTAH